MAVNSGDDQLNLNTAPGPSVSSSTDSVTELILQLESECKSQLNAIKRLQAEVQEATRIYEETKLKLSNLRAEKQTKTIEDARKSTQSVINEWVEPRFPWSDQVEEVLKQTFNFESFRPIQLAAINAVMAEKDVIVVMPTGAGKSLIYQLPAAIEKGYAIVITPLLSLAHDQMLALSRFGLFSGAVNSNQSSAENKAVLEQLVNENTNLKVVFVTPEMLHKSKRLMNSIQRGHQFGLVTRIVVDEVHCCSTWGHDFRPDYQYLGILKTTLDGVPFLGLTATATSSVLADILKQIELEEDRVILTSNLNRPNLNYKVITKCDNADPLKHIVDLIMQKYDEQCGIVYTNTIKEAITVARELKKNQIMAAAYHADMEVEDKKKVHEMWLNGDVEVIVATVAFGMGIDKPDVRFVIHYSMPRSMESMYQESGRAGRDGALSDCVIMFSLYDYLKIVANAESLHHNKKALSVLEYCIEHQRCRREIIAQHFNEVWNISHCNRCDLCVDELHLYKYDVADVCRYIHCIIQASDERLTLHKLIDRWTKQNRKYYKIDINKLQFEEIVAFLINQQYITIDRGFNVYSAIAYLKEGKVVEGPIYMVTPLDIEGLQGERIVNNMNIVDLTDEPSTSSDDEPISEPVDKVLLENDNDDPPTKKIKSDDEASTSKE